MASIADRIPHHRTATHEPRKHPNDAGLVGLKAEIADMPTARIVDDLSLLIELPPALMPQALWRMRLDIWQLQDRLTDEGGVAA